MNNLENKTKELKNKVGLAMSLEECEEFVLDCINIGRNTVY